MLLDVDFIVCRETIHFGLIFNRVKKCRTSVDHSIAYCFMWLSYLLLHKRGNLSNRHIYSACVYVSSTIVFVERIEGDHSNKLVATTYRRAQINIEMPKTRI